MKVTVFVVEEANRIIVLSLIFPKLSLEMFLGIHLSTRLPSWPTLIPTVSFPGCPGNWLRRWPQEQRKLELVKLDWLGPDCVIVILI